MQFNRKEPIYWCDGQHTGNNPMKMQKKGIDPHGNICDVSLATGRMINKTIGNQYAQVILAEKAYRGWVWYYECSKCEPVGSAPAGGFDLASMKLCKKCTEREVLIQTRRDAGNVKAEKYRLQHESAMDKLAKSMEGVIESQRVSGASMLQHIAKAAPQHPSSTRDASEFKNGELKANE